jgi:23S rRNA (uracil1939-C5)-methyltransferase
MAPYEFQVAQKVEIVREVFRRVGKLDAPEEIETIAGEPWGYRNRSQFHFGGHSLGYKAAGSDRVVDVDQCPISAPAINAALKTMRGLRRDKHFPRFLKEVELFTNGEKTMVNVIESERGVAKGFFQWLGESIPGAADGALEYEAAGEKFRVSHKSFFQVNRFLVDRMVECALDGASGGTALDLYAGVGLFTLGLARKFEKVTGVESDASAARDLEFNAERAGLKVKAQRMQSEQYLEEAAKTPDFVLADPPRAGLGKGVVKHLLRLAPERITVVSCDPSTQARDVAMLVGGGYRVERLSVLDLFPQTYHVETIARLSRT